MYNFDDIRLAIYDTGYDPVVENCMLEYCSDAELYLESAVQFNILPKFKTMVERYPELGKYNGLIAEVENTINDAKIKDVKNPKFKNFGHKAFKLIAKVIKFILAVDSVIALPLCIFIFPVIVYFWDRLWVWAMENVEVELTKSQLKLYLGRVEKLKQKADNDELKKLCDKHIKNLNKSLEKLDEEVSNPTVESMEDHLYDNLVKMIQESECLDEDKTLMLCALESVSSDEELMSVAENCFTLVGV